MRRLATILVFPAVMAGALFSAWLGLQQGVAPALIPILVMPVVFGLMVLFERLLPYKPVWNKNDGDLSADILHMLIAQLAIPRLIKPVFVILAFTVASSLLARAEFQPFGWPHHWPLALQVGLMLLIAEFGRYWVHRAAHRFNFLWKLHAVHHSPNRLYWLNAGRFHPIEKVIFLIPEMVPFIIMGTNIETLTLYFIFNGVHGVFQHSNIEVKLGPLNYIFSMTELHRWHHSKIIKESDSNFGNNLIIFDIVFGTFFWPRERAVAVIGLYNSEYPKSYWGHLKAPFMGSVDKPADYAEKKAFYDRQVLEQARQAGF